MIIDPQSSDEDFVRAILPVYDADSPEEGSDDEEDDEDEDEGYYYDFESAGEELVGESFRDSICNICYEVGLSNIDETRISIDISYGASLLKEALLKFEMESQGCDRKESLVHKGKVIQSLLKGLSLSLAHDLRTVENRLEDLERKRIILTRQENSLREIGQHFQSQGYCGYEGGFSFLLSNLQSIRPKPSFSRYKEPRGN